ncbi:MAG: LAGLIDADG family homing endonuclease [bacterium]|nr:LAGLIDADG family homing endonuclease [bacterium]
MKKRGIKPKNNINLKWNPKLAYVVGLITADGSLSRDGRHINFTSKDLQLIKLFKKCLKLRVSIGKKAREKETEKKYFQVQFGNVIFYRWLVDLGLFPNKSRTIEGLKIPDKYFFDFLRGYFDGDGCIYSYWDPRWHSSYMFYLEFTSASHNFLVWLQKIIKKLTKVEGRIVPAHRSFQLRFAKKNTRIVFDKMFYTEKLPCLKRKLSKAKKIFFTDINHK